MGVISAWDTLNCSLLAIDGTAEASTVFKASKNDLKTCLEGIIKSIVRQQNVIIHPLVDHRRSPRILPARDCFQFNPIGNSWSAFGV